MLRFSSMKELKANISPDVVIVDEGPPTALNQAYRKVSSERKVLEDKFEFQWAALGGPPLEREFRFHPKRRWRFDFADVVGKVAFEVQGGLYNPQSGHRSGAGVRRDYEKANAAQELGWKVFFVTSKDMDDPAFIEKCIRACKVRREP